MCSSLNNLFSVTGNNNMIYSKNRIGNRNAHSKLLIIVFQINSINLIESEEFRETSIMLLIIRVRNSSVINRCLECHD